jgi:hypothetical protein
MPRLDDNVPCIARWRRGVVSEQARLQAGQPVDDSLYINAMKCVQAKWPAYLIIHAILGTYTLWETRI